MSDKYANGKVFRYAVYSALPSPKWRTNIFDPRLWDEEVYGRTEIREAKVEDIYAALVDVVRRLPPDDVPDNAYRIAYGHDKPKPEKPKKCKTCGRG